MLDPIFISIAGCVIQIIFENYKKPFIKEKMFREVLLQYLKNFKINSESPMYTIFVTGEDKYSVFSNRSSLFISYQKQLSRKSYQTFYHVSLEQFMLILRDICQLYLTDKQGCFLHASAAGEKKRAILFLGDSGAGKSTIVKLLKNELHPLSDDMLIIKHEEGKYYLHQTPFSETNKYPAGSAKYEVSALLFLNQSRENCLTEISNENTQELIEKQLFSTPASLIKQMKTLQKMSKSIKKYNLFFSFNLDQKIITNIKELVNNE